MNDKEVIRKQYYEARKENIKQQVPCDEVLKHYGVDLLYTDMEVQYRCPLHGDGRDMKKSARYYPEGDNTYCWGCQQYRDQISLVMDFEDCSFTKALSILERKWNVSGVPDMEDFSDPDSEIKEKYKSNLENDLDSIFNGEDSSEDRGLEFVENKIDRLVEDYRDRIEMKRVLKLYHLFDHISYKAQNDSLSGEKLNQLTEKIHRKVEEVKKDVEKD